MRHKLIIILLMLSALAGAQTIVNVTPDGYWSDGNHTWFDRDDPVFYYYQGIVYVFNRKYTDGTKAWNTYLYKFNVKHDNAALQPYYIDPLHENVIYYTWDYKDESVPYQFAFLYQNRLWYSKAEYSKDQPPPCYVDMFFQLPLDTNQYCSWNIAPHDIDYMKMGGFQYDTNMYFVGTQINEDFSTVDDWAIMEYHFNKSGNYFVYSKIMQMPEIKGFGLGGIIRKLDSLGNEYFMINTYTKGGNSYLGKLIPVKGSNGLSFKFIQYPYPLKNILASTMQTGTIKGGKTSDTHPNNPDRLTIAAIDMNQQSDGTHQIHYVEMYFDRDSAIIGNAGVMTLDKSHAPHKVNDTYRLVSCTELIPQDMSVAMSGIDGYQQRMWFFYPDDDQHFKAIDFSSDLWRLDTTQIVTSTDLYDTVSYKGIRSLWTLSGIIDGSPPVDNNWDVWEAKHQIGTGASSLSINSASIAKTAVSSSYQDQWSVGYSVDWGVKLVASLSEDFKYSSLYQNTVTKAVTVKKSVQQQFALQRSSQPYGFYIWTIPMIRRYTFSVYPWWDNNRLQYPVPNSTQYLFRVIGLSTHNEPIPLNQMPFQVNNPQKMQSWSDTARILLMSNIQEFGLSPSMHLDWDDGTAGSTSSLDISQGSSSSYESTVNWKATANLGISVPVVFKRNVSASYQVNYSMETTTETEMDKGVSVSLENLTSKSLGPNLSSLKIDVYWLKPENNPNWWFYDSLNGQRPWYIAYNVIYFEETLALLHPGIAQVLDDRDLMFSWRAENGELGNYTFFISTSSVISPENTVFRQPVGDLTAFTPKGFNPDPGRTYYWAVRGTNKNGNMVWSERRSFIVNSETPEENRPNIVAHIFPNPGSPDEIRIVVQASDGGPVNIALFDMNGLQVTEKTIPDAGHAPVTVSFPGLLLSPGVYFARIGNEKGQFVKKIMIH